ncbi:MAG: DUF6456 domain-containing protein [Alphaproteobacteria bacterium]|nr:DUF6456 domain-containing protein [Alphaproteobacteria bacterium]
MPQLKRLPVSTDKRFRSRRDSDFGPQERWQHSGRALEATDRPGILAARATEEHILDILGLKLILTALQIDAGMKFKADYLAASIAARVTGSYSGAPGQRDSFRTERERSDAEEAAYTRWRRAVREMGRRNGTAVIKTVCHDETPAPRDLPALREGLEMLAAWYGAGSSARCGQPFTYDRTDK